MDRAAAAVQGLQIPHIQCISDALIQPGTAALLQPPPVQGRGSRGPLIDPCPAVMLRMV